MLYDDIGFVVVNDKGFTKPWYTVQLFDTTNRTDSRFEWFDKLNPTFNLSKFKVLGYSMKKEFKDIREADTQFDLSELQVDVDINLCSSLLTGNNKIKGFHVPCYYSCTLWQFRSNDIKCKNFHGVDGGALINMWDNKLLGIATWGINSPGYNLPVGFSVPNSASFFEDYECAKRIKDANVEKIDNGYYQGLCDQRK